MRASRRLGVGKRDERSSLCVDGENVLVERIAEGDERSFERMFHMHYAPLCGFAFSYLRSREAAEDVVQTVFLRIWAGRRTWDPQTGVRAYLFTACRHVALDWLTHDAIIDRTAADAVLTGETLALGEPPCAPDEAAHAVGVSELLRAAVTALPERRRAAVMLRWQYGLGSIEVAQVLGISIKGVEASLARARKDLRRSLANVR